MIRSLSFRLLALAASVAVVLSCDPAPTAIGEFDGTAGGPGAGAGSGSGAPAATGDGRYPVAVIDTPAVYGSLVNIGDSILVAVRVRDNESGIRSVVISGVTISGNAELGTERVVQRYRSVSAPNTGSFPPGTAVGRDTILRRVLFPSTPIDSTPDSLVIRAVVTDHSGLAVTVSQVVRLVTGPRVVILNPINGDSVRPATRLNIQFSATHPDGVAEVRLRVQGDANWPTPMDVTFPTYTYVGNPREVGDTASVLLPADAPGRSRITITAEAVDANRIPGYAAPVVIRIRASEASVPLVKQVVPPRAELGDSIIITATGGNGLRTVGFIVRENDSNGALVKRDSMLFPGDDANLRITMSMALPPSVQGRRVSITSFATDRSGRTGYSVSATSSTPVENVANALSDTVLVVYGRTYRLPRPGLAGDVAVDPANGQVFVSNTQNNRLELWRAAGTAFDPVGVAVGAQPWGMTVSATDPSVLLVANSGGTNISRVSMNPADVRETSRILTRNTVAYSAREVRDPTTGKIRMVLTGPFSYSDRPQYIAQSAGGRIYYSTRPTSSAPVGTLRYLDPTQAVPDSRQVWEYGAAAPTGEYALLNLDFATVIASPADSPISDSLIVCDHPMGTAATAQCSGSRLGIFEAVANLRAMMASDAIAVPVSLSSLALTDTTFVAWTGDRNWIAFGEGNKPGASRVMMAHDPAGTNWNEIFFSPGLDVSDLVENAAERVFGLALDARGGSLAVHGTQSYFGSVAYPFHLRMQGNFDSFDDGAGIAYHPLADIDPASPGARNDPTRLVFVASANGTIEIVDAYYFVSRGRVAVRNPLYGPLRASLPLTAEEVAAGVAVKLYGLTQQGLVVVDISNADIKDIP